MIQHSWVDLTSSGGGRLSPPLAQLGDSLSPSPSVEGPESHVTKTVSSCFAVLHQLRSIRRSVSRSVLQSLVSFLVMPRLDYCNATLAGIPTSHFLSRLQSVMNASARLIFSSSRFDHITPLLRQLHWLKASERIAFECTVHVARAL